MISATAEYALRAVVFLAQTPELPRTAQEISEGTKVPVGYLSKILQALVRKELITSQRGLGGGFTLCKDIGEITVYDVFAAVDGAPERIRACPLGLKGHVSLCPVHKLVDDALGKIEDAFRSATIKQLARSTRGSKPLCEVNDDAEDEAPAAPAKKSRAKG